MEAMVYRKCVASSGIGEGPEGPASTQSRQLHAPGTPDDRKGEDALRPRSGAKGEDALRPRSGAKDLRPSSDTVAEGSASVPAADREMGPLSPELFYPLVTEQERVTWTHWLP